MPDLVGFDGQGAPAAPTTGADASAWPDTEVLVRIAQGDADAFRAFFTRHGPSVHALTLRVARDRVVAEDATQEAFLAVWSFAARYRADRGSVRAWLMTIAHHAAVDRVRREEARRRPLAPPERLFAEDFSDLSVEAVDGPVDRARVRAALARLPDHQRQIVELMYFAGRSQAQIAKLLEIPLGTVKSRCLAAMRTLRTELDRASEVAAHARGEHATFNCQDKNGEAP